MTSLRGLGVGESSQIPLRCTVPSRCAKIRSLTEKSLHPEQNISIRECSSMSRYAEYADCGVIALACSASAVHREAAGLALKCGDRALLRGVAPGVALDALDGVDKFLLHDLHGILRECAVVRHRVQQAVQQKVAALLLQLFAVESISVVNAAYGERHGAAVPTAPEIVGHGSAVQVGIPLREPGEVGVIPAAVGEDIRQYREIAAASLAEFVIECNRYAVGLESSVGYP